MGALRQPRPSEPVRKPPAVETKRDKYGRDPNSPLEQLRGHTDYETETGYSPLYDGALADLPRLTSGNVCTLFLLVCNMLSLGRQRAKGSKRFLSTEPISALDLAVLCHPSGAAGVRDIQRLLSELPERGLISVKQLKNGTTRYVISLLYSKWQGLEDYAVWKRRQVVEIDSAAEEAEADDSDLTPISKDAVVLFKRPAVVRPGRASRATRVNVGVREVVCQNDSPTVDIVFSAVVQSGRLVVSSTSQAIAQKGESEAKGEDKGNAERHPCRALPTNEGSGQKRSKGESYPLENKVSALFDPILQRSGARLLSPDQDALRRSLAELGAMPYEYLEGFMFRRDADSMGGCRAERKIGKPIHVVAIVREARQNWEQQAIAYRSQILAMHPQGQAQACRQIIEAEGGDWTAGDKDWARSRLAKLEGRDADS